MSPLDPPVPPSGEEIHIPGGSMHPLLLAVGITLTLVGITIGIVLLVAGLALTIGVIFRWIVEARSEFRALPADHNEH